MDTWSRGRELDRDVVSSLRRRFFSRWDRKCAEAFFPPHSKEIKGNQGHFVAVQHKKSNNTFASRMLSAKCSSTFKHFLPRFRYHKHGCEKKQNVGRTFARNPTFLPEIKSWATFCGTFSPITSCQTKCCPKINILVKDYASMNMGVST